MITSKRRAPRPNGPGLGKGPLNFNRSGPLQIHSGGHAQKLRFLRYNHQPVVFLPVSIHLNAPRKPLPEIGLNVPADILGYRAGLLLRISSEEGKQKLPVLAECVDILFFKIHVHADQPQFPDSLQGRDGIAGKTGN